MASLNVGNLGGYLREQRRNAQLSLRQLADAAGVSNPYLSQIERGLRKPSADILQQLAKALRISAETLYVQAGMLDERGRDELETRAVILADPSINERQKQVLLQIYESFRKENALDTESPDTESSGAVNAGGAVSTDSVENAATVRSSVRTVNADGTDALGGVKAAEVADVPGRSAGAEVGGAGGFEGLFDDGSGATGGSAAATPPSH
ncbi:helix-turn-helix domain-containing protein [Streptomyces sp. GMY02]|uniref:helix-turn-helix domain-containing protein n=1 Tax=Streptomyces sp. GMY02 TaxID=1333528 RepID=UPI001C2BD00E|nr:helix-turn-helix transcriptional regulator [Streptomyces sp. GMY02]QXE36147.1 helix-turn-helix domain-containing protein [Streptomyces sp. GMY02]